MQLTPQLDSRPFPPHLGATFGMESRQRFSDSGAWKQFAALERAAAERSTGASGRSSTRMWMMKDA